MKRKLKTGSIKGTPLITKFFKKNPDIKAKPLTAVVAISNISKSTVNDQFSKSTNANDKRGKVESEVEVNITKRATEFAEGNKAILETNLLSRKNVNDLALIAEDIINKEFEAGVLVSSSPKRSPEKAGKINRTESKNCATEQLSAFKYTDKNCMPSEREEKKKNNAESISKTKIQNGCLNNAGVSGESSNCNTFSPERLGSNSKLFDPADPKQLNSNSDNELAVTSAKFLGEKSFPCEREENLSSPAKNTVNKNTEGTPKLPHKNYLYTCAVSSSITPDDLDICARQIGNSNKELPKAEKIYLSAASSAPCQEIAGSVNENSCSNLSAANEKEDLLISLLEESMEDGLETELSDEMILEAIDRAINADGKESPEDYLLELTDSEMKDMNEKKMADLEVKSGARDSASGARDSESGTRDLTSGACDSVSGARDSAIDNVGKSETNDVPRSSLSEETNDATNEKDLILSLMEESTEDCFGTELSNEMLLEAIDRSINSDGKESPEDCLLEPTDSEMKDMNENKMADSEVEGGARDLASGACDSTSGACDSASSARDSASGTRDSASGARDSASGARDSAIDNVGKSENNDVSRSSPSKETNDDARTTAEEQSYSEKDDDESSDDELLNPVAFLCDQRMKPDVRTPEKGLTPIMGSPLTPITPFVAHAKDVAGRLKYSLDKLLLEKPKQVEREKELARLQLAMQETIEQGRNRNSRLVDDVGTEQEDDEKALLPIHQRELEKYNSTDKGFSERTHGENIFPGLEEPVKHKNGCSQPFPAVETSELDEFTTFLYQRCDVEIRELLGAGWITHRYLVHPCPRAVVQWLFHILCYHVDVHTVKAGYNALWSMLNVKDSRGKSRTLSWIPDVEDVLKVFNNYGADFTFVLRTTCEGMHIGENLVKLTGKKDLSTDTNEEQESSFFPLVNFTRLIQFITLCVARHPERYTTEDTEHLVLLLYCISLDTRMDICQHDIKTGLQAMYGAIEPSCWMEKAIKLSAVIYRIETHHRNKLRIVQLQPYSCRGQDIKRLAALQMFALLLGNNSITELETFIRSDFDESMDREITNTLELFTKLKMLLHEVRVNDDTDYYQLYTMMELLDIVIGAEYLPPQEKAIVEKITKKLRSLHSDIKDPRAMFISRSKVKDLILRSITKFTYMTQGQKRTQPQKSITTFFVEGKSDLHIETLKDSEIVEEEEEEELASQESYASSFILDPIKIEYSDNESQQGTQELP